MLPYRVLLLLALAVLVVCPASATSLLGLDTKQGVYAIDGSTGASSKLGTLSPATFGSFFVGFDFDASGGLYGYKVDGEIYRIDPVTLAADLVFDTGFGLSEGDVSFHPVTGDLFVIGGGDLALLRIDLQRRSVGSVVYLPFAPFELNPDGLAFDPSGNLFVQDNRNDQYLQIDPETGAVLSTALFSFPPPPYGIGLAGPIGGLDYDPETGEFFARSGASLFRGDPRTGTFVPISLFPSAPVVMGAVAVVTVPEPGRVVLVAILGWLASRRLASPKMPGRVH